MSDYTLAFEELHLIQIGGLLAGSVDGAAYLSFGLSRTDMRFDAIKLNVFNKSDRKTSYVTLTDGDRWFEEICNALVIDATYGEKIERDVAAHWSLAVSAYDKARDQREAA